MKIYEVHYDNGEPWENNFHDSEAFFLTYEKALDYIKNEVGATVEHSSGKRTYYYMPAYVCSRNLDSCQDCPDWCNSENYNGKLFADPHTGEVSEWCPDYLDKQECEQDSSFWTIVEYEVRE